MSQPTQLSPTGIPQIDKTIQGLIELYELLFPNRILACYLVGSHADGSAVSLSDLDLRLIFKGDFAPGEEARFRQARQACRRFSPLPIDLPPLSEHRLHHDDAWCHEALTIKTEGIFVYGQDIRPQLQNPTFDQYLRNVTQAPPQFLTILHNQCPLVFPLTYPDPNAPFYGYTRRDDDQLVPEDSTKMLILAVGFAATCLIGLQAGQIITKKSDWLPAYKRHINDQWTPFLEALYTQGKLAWHYRIPPHPADQDALHTLCHQTLAFENHYLTVYHQYLTTTRQSPAPHQQAFAHARLQEIIYPDQEIKSL